MSKTWTEEREAILVDMWTNGRSVTEIARVLKVSRSAAGGKLHRLGLMGDIRACNARYFRVKNTKIKNRQATGLTWDQKLFEPYEDFKARMAKERAARA